MICHCMCLNQCLFYTCGVFRQIIKGVRFFLLINGNQNIHSLLLCSLLHSQMATEYVLRACPEVFMSLLKIGRHILIRGTKDLYQEPDI